MLSVELSSCCSCDVFSQYFAVKRVKYSARVPPFCFNYQNNSTSSPGFLGQRFNNLQPGCTFDVILTLSVQYDIILSKCGQHKLVMVNYRCGFNQSQTGKYFDWIIKGYMLLMFMNIYFSKCHAFWHISLPSLHDFEVKVPNFTFCGGRKHKGTLLFFSWTSIRKKIANISRTERDGTSAMKKARIHFLYRAFSHVVTAAKLVLQDNGTGDHVGVPRQSCGSWPLFLCKNVLLFQSISIYAGQVSENAL